MVVEEGRAAPGPAYTPKSWLRPIVENAESYTVASALAMFCQCNQGPWRMDVTTGRPE